MKAAVFLGREQIQVQEVPVPECRAHELLLRVELAGICGTDVKTYFQGARGKLRPPHIIGHEIAGTVAQVGSNVAGYSVGDRVGLATEVGCGHCNWCTRGLYKFCEEGGPIGWLYPGGFAEYMLVPELAMRQGNALRMPSDIPFEETVFLEPLACCISAQRFLNIGWGDTVVVMGTGGVGCLHALLAGLEPVGKLILINASSERRLELARQAGVQADLTITAAMEDPVQRVLAETHGQGADVVIVAAPSPVAQEQALQMAARRGRVSLFAGLPADSRSVECDTNAIHYKEVSVFGAFSSSLADFLSARSLIANRKLALAPLITHRFSLSEVVKALEVARAGEVLKVVIHPQASGGG
ncbi:MAG: alcohol dehydrogenase catalytic domain-containing protein [Anaerolineales bacterium]|nr:MAG: alcohol dehydrogenase catalytic domain-containing protein [Anaerolineales bacterium]